MKKIFILICLSYFIMFAKGQEWKHIINKDNLTYQQKVALIESYFNANPDLIGQQGSGYKQYKRWKEFVADRIDESGTTKNNPKRMFDYAEYLKENNNNETPKYYIDWQLLGPNYTPSYKYPSSGYSRGVGIIVSLWINPNNHNIIYAGSNTGGIYKTTDGGQIWERKINGLPCLFGVMDIVAEPSNPNNMYICSGNENGTLMNKYGFGIWKTTDGGENWGPTAVSFTPGNGDAIIIQKMAINPINPNIIYAIGNNKFYKTTDKFNTFQVTTFDSTTQFQDIDLRPGYPNTIFIAGNELQYTTNGGTSWIKKSFIVENTALNKFDRIKITFQENNPSYIYTMIKTLVPASKDYTYACESFNGGATFNSTFKIFDDDRPFNQFGFWKSETVISPDNINIMYFGAIKLYKSINKGRNFSIIPPSSPTYYHDDIRELKFLNTNNGAELFIGTDGGVCYTNDGAATIKDINGLGLAVNQFYGLGIHQNYNRLVYGGLQDCSIQYYENGEWYNTSGGDGGDCLIDPDNSKRIVGNANGWPRVSLNGNNFNHAYGDVYQFPRFDAPIIMQPKNKKVYIGIFDTIFYTPDTSNWMVWQIKSKLPDGTNGIRAMAFDPKHPDTMYIVCPLPTWTDGAQEKKLWKTTNGGETWIDLTPNMGLFLRWHGMSHIAVDPINTNIIYISLADFGDERVLKTTDGGITWTNFSNGLPNFPVNKIKFKEDSHELFVATDVGMFYYDNIQNKWLSLVNNMVPTIVTDFEFKYNENKIYISTFGNGIYEGTVSTTPFNYNPIVITRDTTITNGKFKQDIIITNKSKLYLYGTNTFIDKKGIYIDAGSRLYLNNTTLTADIKGFLWQGITVLGDYNMPSYINRQGYVSIINSTISNAICAVKTVSDIQYPITRTNCAGGIIDALNSNFINNIRSIEYAPYNYPYFGGYAIRNCIFKIDGKKWFSQPNYFITLNSVSNINILGNSFDGKFEFVPPDSINDIYSGIKSINSQFTVDEYKIENNVVSTNTFKKLNRAIYAINTIPGNTIKINKAVFGHGGNNFYTVYLSGLTNAVLTSNIFKININKNNSKPYCVYLDNCTGYHFEDNTLFGESVRYNNIGLVINNSGNDINYIYRNKFDKITYAILAQGNNRGSDIYTGLKIKCNNMGFNYTTWGSHSYMISVTNAHDPQGISVNQGSYNIADITSPAGNLFYHHTKTISEYFNSGNHINYFHHDSASNLYVKPQKLFGDIALHNTPHQYNLSCCPTTLDTGNNGGGNATDYINTMNNELDAAHDGIEQLQQLKDGGNTEILKTEVELANSWQALQLRDELLNQSPFVTDTVLGSAIQNENALPNALLRQVLVANPHAAKNNTLMQQLDERNNPMPDYMITDIETGKNKVSAKEIMEANISEHLYNSAFAKNKLKAMFLNDTTDTTSHAAYRLLLTNSNKRNDKYELAYDYLKTGDINNSEITMTEAASDDMDDEENEEYLDNQLLFDIYKRLVSEDKWLTEVEEREITTIRTLAAKDKYMVHAWAKNWLQLIDPAYEYLEPVILPENGANLRMNKNMKTTANTNATLILQAQPNPAKDYMIVQYEMADADGLLEIRDVKGTIQYTQVLKSTKDQMVIETKSWKSGMFVCSLKSNTTLLKSIVIHIVK